jgi:predicted P-loop ATPase
MTEKKEPLKDTTESGSKERLDNPNLADSSLDVNPITAIGRDLVTVLTAKSDNAILAKKWRLGKDGLPKKSAVSPGTFFDAEQFAVNSIYDFAKLIKRISADPRKGIIRGNLKNPKLRAGIKRRCKGVDADFVAAKRHWQIFDFDGIEWPDIDYANPRKTVEAFIDSIPQFRGVSVYWVVSSSWGFTPGLRLWLCVFTTDALTDKEAKRFAGRLRVPADVALFNPVQLHYTARPAFGNGAVDPVSVGTRSGMRFGDLDELYIGIGDYGKELEYWIRKVEELDDGEARHPVVNTAAYSLGGWVCTGIVSQDDLTTALLDACAESEAFDADRLHSVEDEIKRGIADGMKDLPRDALAWEQRLIEGPSGIKSILENVMLMFREHSKLKGILRFNVRLNQAEFVKAPPWEDDDSVSYPRVLTDDDDTRAASWFQRQGLHGVGSRLLCEVTTTIAGETPYDAVVGWLDALPRWDQVPRVESLFPFGAGIVDSAYTRGVGRCFMISMVARALRPGCKVDMVPTLQGPEGVLKSTFYRKLADGPGDECFCDTPGDFRNTAKLVESTRSAWLVEDAEMAAASIKERESVKRAITVQSDTVRLAWARKAQTFPRRFVFVATTNDESPLVTHGINRRWPVMRVGKINIKWLTENRDQLFAEAVYRFKAGEQWHLNTEEEKQMRESQEDFIAEDPWSSGIDAWLAEEIEDDNPFAIFPKTRQAVTTFDVLTKALGIDVGRITRRDSMRVAAHLKTIGWQHVRLMVNGRREWYFTSPDWNGVGTPDGVL